MNTGCQEIKIDLGCCSTSFPLQQWGGPWSIKIFCFNYLLMVSVSQIRSETSKTAQRLIGNILTIRTGLIQNVGGYISQDQNENSRLHVAHDDRWIDEVETKCNNCSLYYFLIQTSSKAFVFVFHCQFFFCLHLLIHQSLWFTFKPSWKPEVSDVLLVLNLVACSCLGLEIRLFWTFFWRVLQHF